MISSDPEHNDDIIDMLGITSLSSETLIWGLQYDAGVGDCIQLGLF